LVGNLWTRYDDADPAGVIGMLNHSRTWVTENSKDMGNTNSKDMGNTYLMKEIEPRPGELSDLIHASGYAMMIWEKYRRCSSRGRWAAPLNAAGRVCRTPIRALRREDYRWFHDHFVASPFREPLRLEL
jgi:hypothetical protein